MVDTGNGLLFGNAQKAVGVLYFSVCRLAKYIVAMALLPGGMAPSSM
jgi:hypothetical protein